MNRQEKIVDFEWTWPVLEKIAAKHGLSQAEVEEAAFGDAHVRRGPDGLYYLYGRTAAGRYVFIVYRPLGGGVIRPVTARDMTKAEKNLYLRSV